MLHNREAIIVKERALEMAQNSDSPHEIAMLKQEIAVLRESEKKKVKVNLDALQEFPSLSNYGTDAPDLVTTIKNMDFVGLDRKKQKEKQKWLTTHSLSELDQNSSTPVHSSGSETANTTRAPHSRGTSVPLSPSWVERRASNHLKAPCNGAGVWLTGLKRTDDHYPCIGLYTPVPGETISGARVFRHINGNVSHSSTFYLFYHIGSHVWRIGPHMGTVPFVMAVKSKSTHPAEITAVWSLFPFDSGSRFHDLAGLPGFSRSTWESKRAPDIVTYCNTAAPTPAPTPTPPCKFVEVRGPQVQDVGFSCVGHYQIMPENKTIAHKRPRYKQSVAVSNHFPCYIFHESNENGHYNKNARSYLPAEQSSTWVLGNTVKDASVQWFLEANSNADSPTGVTKWTVPSNDDDLSQHALVGQIQISCTTAEAFLSGLFSDQSFSPTAAPVPQPCPSGKYQGSVHGICSKCARGQWTAGAPGATVCVPHCLAGHFEDAYLNEMCHICPGGKWTGGAAGAIACVPVPTVAPTASPTVLPTPALLWGDDDDAPVLKTARSARTALESQAADAEAAVRASNRRTRKRCELALGACGASAMLVAAKFAFQRGRTVAATANAEAIPMATAVKSYRTEDDPDDYVL
jgi:hypothetical protein